MSRLGALYDKVLKLKSRARLYFKICMQLALSMHPRNFSAESKQTLQCHIEIQACSELKSMHMISA